MKNSPAVPARWKLFSHQLPVLVLLLANLGSVSAIAEDSLPLRSVNKANELIDAALKAHGGEEALEDLKSLIQRSDFVTYATGQSLGTEPPWDVRQQGNFNAIDLENKFIYTWAGGGAGGFEFNIASIAGSSGGWQLDYRAGTATPVEAADYITTAGPFIRVTPPLIMKQLMERRQYSHWLGTEMVDGRAQDIVTLVMETGPGLSLYLDSETHMLTAMERVLPPFGQVGYQFADYETVAGIPFNRTFKLTINGEPNIDSKITRIEVNVEVEPFVDVPAKLQRTEPQPPDDFNLQEIDEGIFLVGGNGAYGLFVEMDDHLVAVGGTQGAKARIEEVQKHVSNKPLRYGVLTHHHSDHVPGAADYAATGATVVALLEHESVVRKAAGDETADFQWVQGSAILEDGSRRIELLDIGPTPHSEHLLVAWLPEEKILFEADHFPQPISGPVPPAVESVRALAAAIERLGLDYEYIVGAHSRRVSTPEDMRIALTSKVQSGNFAPSAP